MHIYIFSESESLLEAWGVKLFYFSAGVTDKGLLMLVIVFRKGRTGRERKGKERAVYSYLGVGN